LEKKRSITKRKQTNEWNKIMHIFVCVCVCVHMQGPLGWEFFVFFVFSPYVSARFNEFFLYVNLFSFEFFCNNFSRPRAQMASRRAQKCDYAFINEINCRQMQTKSNYTRMCTCSFRSIEKSSRFKASSVCACVRVCEECFSRTRPKW